MFYPERMSRVTIAAPKLHMSEIINTLYRLRALHIQEYVPRKQGDLPIGSPAKDAERVSELLLGIQAIKKQVFLEAAEKKPVKWNLRKIEGFIGKMKNGVDALNARIKDISTRISEDEKNLEEYEFLLKCGISDPGILGEYRTLLMISGYADKPLQVEDAVIFSSKEKPSAVVLFIRREDREKTEKILEKAKFSEFRLRSKPPGSSVKAAAEGARKEIAELKEEKSRLLAELEKIGQEYGALLNGAEEKLLSTIQRSEAPLKFAASDYAFIAQGWIPEKNTARLLERLTKLSPGIYIKVEEAKDAPTKMENPKAVKPFEFFLNLYSLPKYSEIDPSFLIFFTFPLFYGLMLGDIGYGFVLLALSLALRLKTKKMRALVDVTILSALMTIAFGFVFGEVFGAEEIAGIRLHPYLHRLGEVNQLIVASAVLGLVHINAGFILGFMNELRSHGIMKAVLTKLSWVGLQAGLVILALGYFKYISVSMYVPAAIILVSAAALLKGEGLIGIIEIPSLIGNILSYLRLAAIGLASASIAIVVNEMAGGFFEAGGISFALGVLVLVMGHTINLALGILDSFLQSLRLHYVEMFTKFYHGAGKPYKPFGSR